MTITTEPEWFAAESAESMEALIRSAYDPSPNGNGTGARPALVIEDYAAVSARVDALPHPGWLARPVWPADAHGVIGAEDKAGKTWMILDLAVAKAAGGLWLGTWPVDKPGKVLAFLGEGGERKMVRRLRAVAGWHGHTDADLGGRLRLCFRVPHLGTLEHLALVDKEMETHKPELIIVDPLYLAARGASGSDIYDMGAHLEGLQAVTQMHGAGLVVVTHWNKTGTGTGRARFTGAGPAAWGRVTVSVNVEHRRTVDTKSVVKLKAEVVGDEVPDTEIEVTRTVWADDIDDLASPMHYELEVTEVDLAQPGSWHGPTECMTTLSEWWEEQKPGQEFPRTKVTDEFRAWCKVGNRPTYRDKTVIDSLNILAQQGHLSRREGPRRSTLYSLGERDELDIF